MARTGHGQIGCKFKGENCNSKYKPASKCNNIYTDLIEYVSKKVVKKEVIKKTKHVDTVVNSIHPLPFPITKAK